MSEEPIYKTISQYSQLPISTEDMEKLLAIGADYCTVKNYVYRRYSGIKSFSKLYPGYTIQNEMTASGLREKLDMPSVYFYLAIFDALGDIKSEWARLKKRLLKLIKQNENFTEEDKHYLRFILKVNNLFDAILNHTEVFLPKEIEEQYDKLREKVNEIYLQNYLRRAVRKKSMTLHTEQKEGFSISGKAYRYQNHGISITTKVKRKRVFVPLTDSNSYQSQLYIQLYPKEQRLEVHVPIQTKKHIHKDYIHEIGIATGMYIMFTTDGGNRYGEKYGEYQFAYADWLREQTTRWNKNKHANNGRKKYSEQKRKKEETLHTYINQELNRMIRQEKPKIIYIPKLPKPQATGKNKKINFSVAVWQRGYIRKRLQQKCKEHSITLIEVNGKDISKQCSCCGQYGIKKTGRFICETCGYSIEEKINTARNVKKRGECGEIIK